MRLVTAEVRCDGPRPRLRLSQRRYVPIGSAGAPAEWKVPMCVRWSEDGTPGNHCFLLDQPSAEFALEGARGCPAWISANDNAAGYFRSVYEGEWFDRLLERGLGELAPHEQMALVSNVQALASGGQFDIRRALALALRFGESGDRDVLSASLRIAGMVAQVIPDSLEPVYTRFIRA